MTPGFDYLRARTGHSGLQLQMLRGDGEAVVPPAERAPSNGRRATAASVIAASAEATAVGRPSRREAAPGGRRAKQPAKADSDDDELPVVLTREAHVQAIRKRLDQAGVQFPLSGGGGGGAAAEPAAAACGFGRALA